jgi:DNA gyrase inhibitor GyrI
MNNVTSTSFRNQALRLQHGALALSALSAVALLTLFPAKAMAIEHPKYEVVTQEDNFELRQYAPMVIAETWVTGTLDDASSRGFRAIAGYIFGDNKRANAASEKIAMTAPVTMEKQDASVKIAMTAPVTMDKEGERWRMHFVMPSQYKLADLPTPNNAEVKLREIPGKRVAAIRFSGFSGEAKVAAQTALLNEWMQKQGLVAANAPQLARYNPPITPPFFRRNEVLIEVQ